MVIRSQIHMVQHRLLQFLRWRIQLWHPRYGRVFMQSSKRETPHSGGECRLSACTSVPVSDRDQRQLRCTEMGMHVIFWDALPGY